MNGNLLIILALSTLGMLPFDILHKKGIYSLAKSTLYAKKWFLGFFWGLLWVLLTFRVLYKFIKAVTHWGTTPWHHIESTAVVLVTTVCMLASAWICFFNQPDLNCKLINIVLKAIQTSREKSILEWIKTLKNEPGMAKLSAQMALFELMPLQLLNILGVIPVLYLYDPEVPVLTYSDIPLESRTWTAFLLCMVADALYASQFLIIEYYVSLLTLGSLGCINFKIYDVRQYLKSSVTDPAEELSQAHAFTLAFKFKTKTIAGLCTSLREIQLHIQYFNVGLSYVVFWMKTYTQGVTLICLFAATKLCHSHKLMAVLNLVFFIQLSHTFIGTYDPALSIPEDIRELKSAIESESNKVLFRSMRRKFRAIARSLPDWGIKVGSFGELERATTASYVHFLVSQTVSLLVTF